MTLNKREQLIAWTLGVVVGLGVLYYAGTTWWRVRLDLDKKIKNMETTLAENKITLERASHVAADLAAWKIQTIALDRPNPAVTDALVRSTYTNAGLNAGMTITGWGGAGLRPATGGSQAFQESKYTASATTTTARLARFLQTIENAAIPARIDSLTITTPKQGLDNLHVEMTISALLYAPRTTGVAGAATPQPATGRGPEATQPATRGSTGRPGGRGTGPAGGAAPGATTKAGPTAAELSKLEQQMIERKRAEEARLATMPAAPPEPAAATGPKKTAEEIEAEMKAKRLREQGGPAESEPATTTSPATTGGAP